MKTRHLRGFTLVEILVAIAVIGILAALLYPSLKKSREQANEALCANRLANIGKAVILYTNDHEMTLPGPPVSQSFAGWFDNSANPQKGGLISSFLAPYLGSNLPDPPPYKPGYSKEFICPTWEGYFGAKKVADVSSFGTLNCYVVNRRIIVDGVPVGNSSPWGVLPGSPASWGSQTPMKLISVWQPSKNWMITELDQQGNFGSSTPLATPIHKTFRNAVFFDAHVERVPVNPSP
ncbi:MAG: type II secretion system protein [Verrucomicrobia bacterium]|nr:type II secretion system protein [Verrucomicrobiota bacterium]